MTLRFLVEQAGCASCAELVREALSELGGVESVEIDEVADVAEVVLSPLSAVTVDGLDRVLERASARSGHAYRVRPGSFVATG